MVENDELEVVEEMAAEAVVDDGVGVVVATEECAIPSIDVTNGHRRSCWCTCIVVSSQRCKQSRCW